jgi:hypothetical protein
MKTLLLLACVVCSFVLASIGPSLAAPPAIQIPEPSSLALLAGGAAVVAWVKFRKRQ